MKKGAMKELNKDRRKGINNKEDKNKEEPMRYTIKLYYGGQFVYVPMFAYTSTQFSIYNNIDFENIDVHDLKVCFGEVIGELDTLYYRIENVIKLLSNESKFEIIEYSRTCKNVVTLYVYHLTLPVVESENDDDYFDDHSCSDDEFVEIRKKSRLEKQKLDELQEQNYSDEDSDSASSFHSGSQNYMNSEEESDNEICYATPPISTNGKCVDELFNEMTHARDIKWKIGLIFADKKQLKNVVRSSSMETGRPYHYLVDDKRRVQVGCAKNCPFKMWVTFIKETQGWQIKTLRDDHNCVWNYNNRLVTVKWLADKYGDRIRKNPNWKLGEMQDEFKRELKVDVGQWKCCRVRQRSLKGVQEKMREHYANVRKFGGEILRSNSENTVKITTTRLQDGDPPRFQRMYISYAGLKKAWKETCRPVLGLDGCFLKTVTGGQLLSAVGRDGNNSILPVAMAVVESENYESWKWFLELLIEDLELGEGTGTTIISDQQKGLDKAIRELMSYVEHEKRDSMQNADCIIVPKTKSMLDEAIKDSTGFRVLWDGRDKYVVKGNGTSCEVSLNNRTCSCRVWELTGVPCCHAVTAIQDSRQNPIDFVAHWFTKETYMKCYSNCIEVIKGEEFWDDVIGDTILPPLIVKKLRGRPKKCRRREGWEGGRGTVSSGKYKRMSYTGRVMHCGYCKKEGHKINTCPDKPHDYVPPKSSGKRGRPKKVVPQQLDEIKHELDLQSREATTGEDTMMEELLNQMENENATQEQVPSLGDDFEIQPTTRMRFMPTPAAGRRAYNIAKVSGSTPPASTPPNATLVKKKRGKKTCASSQLSNSQRLTKSASGSVSKKVHKFTPPRTIKK